MFTNVSNKIASVGRSVGAFVASPSKSQIQAMLFLLGIGLVTAGMFQNAFAQDSGEYNADRINQGVTLIFTYLEGSFGALIMVVGGLGAIMSAAFGQYKAALGLLVVAVGAFILRAFVKTFFNYEGIETLEAD